MTDGALLVVAPHATATGSTRVLIELLERAAPGLSVPLEVTVESGGPWLQELRALGPEPLVGSRPAAVLVNSCLAAGHLVDLDDGVPSLVYVHEAGSVISALPDRAARGLRRADLVLCVSEGVQADLVAAGIRPEATFVLPPLVIPAARATDSEVAATRAALGLGADDRMVLACGEASERKGADLFVQFAVQMRRYQEVHFVWLGRRLRSIARMLDHDTEAIGMNGRLTWAGQADEVAPYLAAADLLVMTSRVDPQPLVPLEAAQQGTATVAFGIGGLQDLGRAGCALTAPYPDVDALALAARAVLDDPKLSGSLVSSALERRDARQSAARVLPDFIAAIERVMALGRRSAS